MLKRECISRHAAWVFWGSFWLLNFILFGPIYWFFQAETPFWPPLEGGWRAFLLQRANLDVFRLNLELTLLVTLWLFWPRARWRGVRWLFFAVYLLQLLYGGYEGFVRSFYLLDPTLYNDLILFADGSRYVVQMLHLPPRTYVMGGMGLLAALALLAGLHWLLLAAVEHLGRKTKLGMLGLTAVALGLFLFSGEGRGGVETAVSSFSAKISQNIALSYTAYTDAQRFDQDYLAPFYQFTTSDLADKPNIHILFIESYGSVLYQRPDFRQRYGLLLNLLETRLNRDAWHMASTRSLAPTWGGGSWIAYTSFLTGLHLDSHAQYLRLFNRFQEEQLPHLYNYLQSQGYTRYYLSSNSDEISEAEWLRYKQFYGVDEWLRYRDLPYSGPLYGWGPAPPDQFAVNYAFAYINAKQMSPYVFFFITQNSHYPWAPLPRVVRDWRTLNDAQLPPVQSSMTSTHAELRRQYMASIEYELTQLVDFIVRQGRPEDLFILIGDHQPPRVARYTDGWDTPIHIISQDEAFVEMFHEYGFVSGLATGTVEAELHHAGFYTLFMRTLLQKYGVDQANLPVYLPEGIR